MRWVRALLKNASLAGAPKYIEHFSKFSPSPLSMKQFLDFGMEGWRAAKEGVPERRGVNPRGGPEWQGRQKTGRKGLMGRRGWPGPERVGEGAVNGKLRWVGGLRCPLGFWRVGDSEAVMSGQEGSRVPASHKKLTGIFLGTLNSGDREKIEGLRRGLAGGRDEVALEGTAIWKETWVDLRVRPWRTEQERKPQPAAAGGSSRGGCRPEPAPLTGAPTPIPAS